ncbi:hypothetical protein SMACR_02728 [Sordaria macrospora]|uniref:WGS project CABT00000000 data, contig 2.11 n=2 Tax=Sordaria macrospora TaxID=5147 RepID=F7VXA7_SORMK|nr:uncharacterized protein SMAC_02728 [Sordaria macrospora k-hell]KAA8636335.1 hypothetical protein SMACR_02728 [Sordaria macrospora]WPJ60441.1 hypothetical protein SMAC4_02728 [Sordaria macrospora]CCC10149.1 unnamed protein product [Sordaria macrospora k-hell]
MKPRRTLSLLALPITSVKAQTTTDHRPTLTETLHAHNDTLSTLNNYIQTQQALFAAINGTSDITILAPSNHALDGLFSNSAIMDDFNSDPDLVEAFWNYHVLRGVWYTSNLTAGTGAGTSSGAAAAAAKKRRKRKRDGGNDVVDESGIDGNSLFIPTLLAPGITPYANVSGGQRVIARSSSSSSSSDSDSEPVVSFYSGITGSGGSQQITKSTITHANFNFSGGTIHIIDHVLSLPSRLNDTLASFSPSSSSSSSSSSSGSSSTTSQDDSSPENSLSLTASVGALSRANLTNLFNTRQDITMFVPSNEAWDRVGSVVSDMDEDELADIMGYHILKVQGTTSGKVFYSDLLESIGSSDASSDGSDGDVSGDVTGGGGSEKDEDGRQQQQEIEKDYETVEGGTVKVRVVDGTSTTGGGGTDAEDDAGDAGESSKQVFVNGARVVKSDVLVENGVVHVVDG